MNDPLANGQLELACRLGSLTDIIEALEDGADINCNGYSPLFFAIQNSDRAVIATLVEHGADVSVFEVDEAKGDVVEQLIILAPDKGQEAPAEGMVELDAKMVRAFDRMIRNKGVAEPIHKGRREEYEAFGEGLRCIAAEECHAVVREFLAEIGRLGTEGQDIDTAVAAYLKDEGNAATLGELSGRYAKSTEEEQPGELLKDYLKERKKVV